MLSPMMLATKMSVAVAQYVPIMVSASDYDGIKYSAPSGIHGARARELRAKE